MAAVIKTVLAGLICSIVIQIAGYVSPGWMFIKYNDSDSREIHLGLWYQAICINKNCNIDKLDKRTEYILPFADIGISSQVQDHRAETTVALIASVIAIASIILFVCKEKESSKAFIRLITTVIATTVSGVLCLVAAGGQLNIVLYQSATYTGKESQGFPYSLFLFGIGGIINCVLSCLLTWYIFAYGDVTWGLRQRTILKNGTGYDSDQPLTRL